MALTYVAPSSQIERSLLMATIDITADNYQTEIVNNDKPAILDFWATWCPHCKRIAPTYAKLADEYDGTLTFGKIDSDEEPGLTQKFDIEYLPTFVVLDKDGNVLDKVVAPAGKSALQDFIHKNLGL